MTSQTVSNLLELQNACSNASVTSITVSTTIYVPDDTHIDGGGRALIVSNSNNVAFALFSADNVLSSNVRIQGVAVMGGRLVANTSSMASYGGTTYVGPQVANCSTNFAPLVGDCFGIKATASNPASIYGCYNAGNVAADGAGGIAGKYAGAGGKCIITNCYNTGRVVAQYAGGISGQYAGAGGTCTISTCYNMGDVSSSAYYAGGITGGFAGVHGICTTTNCYNTGTVAALLGGGIAGGFAGAYNGNCTITNCYNTGHVIAAAGGITGAAAGQSGTCTITNCSTISPPISGPG